MMSLFPCIERLISHHDIERFVTLSNRKLCWKQGSKKGLNKLVDVVLEVLQNVILKDNPGTDLNHFSVILDPNYCLCSARNINFLLF